MSITESTLHDVRTALVGGVARHNRRRARRRLAIVVPALAVVLVGAAVVTRTGERATFAVDQQADGTIRVEVFPGFDEVDELQAALADAGLTAAVVRIAAHPALDGFIEVVSHTNEMSGAMEFSGGEFVIDTATATSEIEILIHVAAEEGENYGASPSLFAPGHVFAQRHCAYDTAPLTSAELAPWIDDANIDEVVWVLWGELDPTTGGIPTTESADRPEGAVMAVHMRDSSTMEAIVDPDSTSFGADAISMSDGTHYGSSPTCADLAAGA